MPGRSYCIPAEILDGAGCVAAEFDDFDFILGDDCDDIGNNLTPPPETLEVQFDSLKESITSSLNDIVIDFEESDDEDSMEKLQEVNLDAVELPPCRGRTLSSPIGYSIDFDPPQSNYQSVGGCGFQLIGNQCDVSHCPFRTAKTPSNVNLAACAVSPRTATSASAISPSYITQEQYNQAIEKLAQTMKRTEESRRQVMYQRELLRSQQLQYHENARLLRRASDGMQISHQGETPYSRHISPFYHNGNRTFDTSYPEESRVNNNTLAAFFTGSRGTLTNGLEQSRRQLQMYMAQVNHHTL